MPGGVRTLSAWLPRILDKAVCRKEAITWGYLSRDLGHLWESARLGRGGRGLSRGQHREYPCRVHWQRRRRKLQAAPGSTHGECWAPGKDPSRVLVTAGRAYYLYGFNLPGRSRWQRRGPPVARHWLVCLSPRASSSLAPPTSLPSQLQ